MNASSPLPSVEESSRPTLKGVIMKVLPAFLFSLVLVVLYELLRDFNFKEVLAAISATPLQHIIAALVLCATNYFVLTFYDTFAFKYVRRKLAYPQIAFTAFVSYTLSHNIGFALVSGGAVRYRLYSAWGIGIGDIARVIFFSGAHFWAGLFLLAGVTSLLYPEDFALALNCSSLWCNYLGMILLIPLLLYLFLTVSRRRRFRVAGQIIRVPRVSVAFSALMVAALDWLLAVGVLYALLPSSLSISYARVLTAFLAAQVVGVVSHVPGGLGVFETVMLVMLSNSENKVSLAGALVLFRVFYYVVPFFFGISAYGIYEARARGLRASAVIKKLAPLNAILVFIVPQFLAISVFVGGAILLLSGAAPTAADRTWWVRMVPLPVVEFSHFVNSVVGVTLLVIAWGIQRRLVRAYHTCVLLLSVGIIVSLLKGLDYEEATYLSILLILLWRSRRYFYRRGDPLVTPHTSHLIAFLTVIAASIWLGFFSYKHVEYTSQLWWQFAAKADASRFLRASVVSGLLALLYGLRLFYQPRRFEAHPPTREQLDELSGLIRSYSSTESNLAFAGDKYLLTNPQKTALIMYRVVGRSWVAMGDPIGRDEEERQALVWEFFELADRHNGFCVFYEVSANDLPLYLDVGLKPLKIGEEAIVPLATFSLEGATGKGFRYTLNRLEKEGYSFEIEEKAQDYLPVLKQISDGWLREKNTREKGFSLGFFTPDYIKRFPVALIKRNGSIIAFANIWASSGREELSVDLMRHAPDPPNSLMEYLFLKLMLYGKEEGYQRFNLGMAPLSGLETRSVAPLWNKFGAYVFKYGEHFYNFEGLRRYKEKFHPQWEPRYLMSPGGVVLPRVLTSVASLVSGGLKGVISK